MTPRNGLPHPRFLTPDPASRLPLVLCSHMILCITFGHSLGQESIWEFIDKTDSAQQTFYGIKEPCVASACATTVVNDDDSLFNTTDAQIFQDNGSISVEGVSGATTWQELLDKAATYPGGWYFNLWKSGTNPSERVINRPTVLGGIVLFTTFIPDTDVCSYGGSSNLYALNYITGTASNAAVIGTSASTGEILNKEELGVGMASGIAIHTGGGDVEWCQ